MKEIINNISNIGDILAIPFFALLINYFYKLENKNNIEYLLFIFSLLGFILDTLFTYLFLSNNNYSIKYFLLYIILIFVLLIISLNNKKEKFTNDKFTNDIFTNDKCCTQKEISDCETYGKTGVCNYQQNNNSCLCQNSY